MRLGHELLKEQLFFRRELIDRVAWFIGLRWLALAAGVVAGGLIYFFERRFPIVAVYTVLFLVLAYNTVFFFIHKRLCAHARRDFKTFNRCAHAQIILDMGALLGLICFTGGIYSPLLFFVLSHLILAGLLLSPLSACAYGLSVVVALGAIAAWLPGAVYAPAGPASPFSTVPWMLYLAFAAAVAILIFLLTTIKLSLRTKGRELLQLSKQLDQSNTKLTALYEMVKAMGVCADLQALMDLATRQATHIMGVKSCAIKLLDDQGKTLSFASTFGLSQDYLAKGKITLEKSAINRKIIEGSVYAAGQIAQDDYFQYPEDIVREGIASMVCLPLRVEKMVLGVFCVYSDVADYFGAGDIEFFTLMADLTALSIERLKAEKNKAWFFQKAAHQLRSPLTAVYTMLKTIEGRYLGPVVLQQAEIIERCRKRIGLLDGLVDDLLTLGLDRAVLHDLVLRPLNIETVLKPLGDLFSAKADKKKLQFSLSIKPGLPAVLAEKKILDDIFGNLIENAIKYTPAGGIVTVSVSAAGENRLRVEVSDTGIGIPDKDKPRLFSEFFRSENAKTVDEAGTGLGLVIVKEALDRIKGTITVQSELGKGTRVTCFLATA